MLEYVQWDVLQRFHKALSAVEHVFFFEGRAKGQGLEKK